MLQKFVYSWVIDPATYWQYMEICKTIDVLHSLVYVKYADMEGFHGDSYRYWLCFVEFLNSVHHIWLREYGQKLIIIIYRCITTLVLHFDKLTNLSIVK